MYIYPVYSSLLHNIFRFRSHKIISAQSGKKKRKETERSRIENNSRTERRETCGIRRMFEKRRRHGFVINEENEFEAPRLCLYLLAFFSLSLSFSTNSTHDARWKIARKITDVLPFVIACHVTNIPFENRLILINRC